MILMQDDFSSSVLEVNLGAVRRNFAYYRNSCARPVIAVVKADAYGIGAIPLAKALSAVGATDFAVARVSEALTLRAAGIAGDILIFSATDAAEIEAVLASDLTLALVSWDQLGTIRRVCRAVRRKARLELKIDTGMGRFGFRPDELPELFASIAGASELEIAGIFSHYANIDDDPDDSFNRIQLNRFHEALQLCAAQGVYPRRIHFSNSAAALSAPESRFTHVRVGSGLFGINPFYYAEMPDGLETALRWRTRLISVRRLPAGQGIGYGQTYRLTADAWVGLFPVGYGDGFRRIEGNEILIEGNRVPVIGRVCCDAAMALLPEALPVGTAVTLIGRDGNEAISVEDLARRWGCSRAGVISGISSRVARAYLEEF